MAKKVGCLIGKEKVNGRCVSVSKIKIPQVRIRNMISSSGREVPNQFILDTKDATYFQSYRTIIAVKKMGKTYLDKNHWDYSKTTGTWYPFYQ